MYLHSDCIMDVFLPGSLSVDSEWRGGLSLHPQYRRHHVQPRAPLLGLRILDDLLPFPWVCRSRLRSSGQGRRLQQVNSLCRFFIDLKSNNYSLDTSNFRPWEIFWTQEFLFLLSTISLRHGGEKWGEIACTKLLSILILLSGGWLFTACWARTRALSSGTPSTSSTTSHSPG